MPYLLLPFGWPLLTGGAHGDDFGAGLASGDLDGDGITDVAVGAPGEGGTGAVHVYLGPAFDEVASFAGTASSEYGAALAIADLDGDGANELIVGAPDAGAVEVIAGLVSSGTWLEGDGAGRFGAALSAGDLDGDGVDDLVVGAPATDADTGAVWVFTAGLTASDVRAGDAAGDLFGTSVAADGDIDGDGDTELLVGAPEASSGVGRASLFLGGAGGPEATAAWTYEGGVQPYAASVGFGDFDGDGDDDVLVAAHAGYVAEVLLFEAVGGAVGSTPSGGDAVETDGRYPVYGASLGDLDGDGADDLAYTMVSLYYEDCSQAERTTAIVLAPLGGAADEATMVTSPRAFVPVGDVDGNGLGDVAFASDDDAAGAVSVRLLVTDADGDGWAGDWGGPLADADDHASATYPGAPETDGDGLDADGDGLDGAPVSTHTSACPSFSTYEEGHAWSELASLEALPAYLLFEDVHAALEALPCARSTERADDGDERQENTHLTCGAGDGAIGGAATRERTTYGWAWSGGYCYPVGTTTWRGVVRADLDEPTASGITTAAFTWGDDARSGWFDATDGTRTTLAWTLDVVEYEYEGWVEWRTEDATLDVDGCSFRFSHEEEDAEDRTWALDDGTHTLAVDVLSRARCPGLPDAEDHAWAELDGVGALVDAATWAPVGGPDDDDDGWPVPADCDDADASIHPCAGEDAADTVDEDCDGRTDFDSDGDGVVDDDDCRPDDPDVSAWVEMWPDADGDGYGAGDLGEFVCEDTPDLVRFGGDCDDDDPALHPGAVDPCDGVDQDCDGTDDCPADAPSPPAGCGGCGTTGPAGWAAALLAMALVRRYRATPRRIASWEAKETVSQ